VSRRWRPWLPPAERELLAAAGGGLYYDRDGEPITLGDWVEAFEDSGYRRVAFDAVGPYEVSTVWLAPTLTSGATRPRPRRWRATRRL
jgi:hypothetical protein